MKYTPNPHPQLILGLVLAIAANVDGATIAPPTAPSGLAWTPAGPSTWTSATTPGASFDIVPASIPGGASGWNSNTVNLSLPNPYPGDASSVVGDCWFELVSRDYTISLTPQVTDVATNGGGTASNLLEPSDLSFSIDLTSTISGDFTATVNEMDEITGLLPTPTNSPLDFSTGTSVSTLPNSLDLTQALGGVGSDVSETALNLTFDGLLNFSSQDAASNSGTLDFNGVTYSYEAEATWNYDKFILTQSIPEPGSAVLAALSVMILGFRRRR